MCYIANLDHLVAQLMLTTVSKRLRVSSPDYHLMLATTNLTL